MTPEIEELRKQKKFHRDEADKLQTAIQGAIEQHLNAVHPLKVGDLVTYKYGNGRRQGRVVKHIRGYSDSVEDAYVVVVTIRKDGSEGEKKELRWYDKPEKVETATA